MEVFSLALGITLAILYTVGCSPVTTIGTASGATFVVDLIHHDSIQSPFYDYGMTFSQRLSRALQRSFNNAKRFESNSLTYQTQIIPDQAEFLMNISFGNPSHQVLAIADTGSDLPWIQCKPCIQCYKHTGSIFNPKLSSTYKALGCKSETCKTISLFDNNCSSTKNCQFTLSYGDGSYSVGDVATETIKLGGQPLQDIVFGCSFRNGGVFRETWGGIIGLGGGDFSLVSQISTLVTPEFSYCLIPFPTDDHLSKLSSKLIFGDISSGSQAVSTPLVPKWPRTFYYVTLEGITVGDRRLKYSDSTNPLKRMHKGNMIVDSGTMLTMLPTKLYEKVETAIKENLTDVRTVKDPQKQLSLCYRAKRVKHAPEITMHFEGADVPLLRYNVFVMVSKRIMCLAMAPSSDNAIFGNLAQSNFLVGYDLGKRSLSFRRTDCTGLKV
ncbi:probable aspartic protease At2g35615 [Cynara cardunculus var. scolymus]|uniref:Aspartic peptidase n=1 Tax=Cynara cardunculus var. scolymus TaxID=59895 RepID=A0A103Y131_CYNCS|nr:probable aspartic protease At2g35615 [Cynara cardunculus var. scolymus]KVI00579.1 Aspartic peptidase [Cynara cardunculus var. scolymus]